jgi:hypothetical protein
MPSVKIVKLDFCGLCFLTLMARPLCPPKKSERNPVDAENQSGSSETSPGNDEKVAKWDWKSSSIAVTLAVLALLNLMPRMVASDGTRWLFAFTVPEPHRFGEPNGEALSAALNRGFPMTMYWQTGFVFTTKDGMKLFLPGRNQPPFVERVSIIGISVNILFASCACYLSLFLIKRIPKVVRGVP